jgi:hypothetical protein
VEPTRARGGTISNGQKKYVTSPGRPSWERPLVGPPRWHAANNRPVHIDELLHRSGEVKVAGLEACFREVAAIGRADPEGVSCKCTRVVELPHVSCQQRGFAKLNDLRPTQIAVTPPRIAVVGAAK